MIILREQVSLEIIRGGIIPVLYSGIMGTGVAFTLLAVSQKHIDPVTVSVIASMESVFALIAGWIVLGEVLSPREMLGAGILLASTIGVQVYGEYRLNKMVEIREEGL